MKFRPIGDLVVILPAPAEEKTSSGIIIPDTAKEKPNRGTVVAAGPGRYVDQTGEFIPMQVKEGEEVIHSKHVGSDIEIDGEDYVILRERDLYGTL